MATVISHTPPRAPAIQYTAHHGTRWEKEKAAAGQGAFDHPEDPKYVGPWIIGECVGKGASGRVRIAKHRHTGQLAAIKILPLQPLINSRVDLAARKAKAEKQRLGIDREITMMKLMNHPNIMRIYDVYEGSQELYLVLEFVEGGELFDFLVNRGRLPPLEALAYFKQIVYGLNYAHAFSIIHRDLKPENILIQSLNPPCIKIADWGMAAFAPPALHLETSCGSPHYASPEIVNGSKYQGTATDIWSCGVILYALLTGRLPFDDKDVRTLLSKVKIGKYDVPSYVDPVARDLLSRMMTVDVHERITISGILAHPWMAVDTPSILYIPAPPVHELARAQRSAAHIDADVLESLLIIWGRHANVDEIKLDLLSPPGRGTLAKAFYFLLQKYREQTLRDSGIVADAVDAMAFEGLSITKQYVAPLTKTIALLASKHRDQQLEALGAPRGDRERPRSAVLSTSNGRSRAARSGSPQGSRTSKSRPVSTPALQTAEINMSNEIRSGSPMTGTEAIPKRHTRPVSIITTSPGNNIRFPIHSPRVSADPQLSPTVVYAPSPKLANTPIILPIVKKPKSANAELQRTIDEVTDKVNAMVDEANAAQQQHGHVIYETSRHVQQADIRMHDSDNSDEGFIHIPRPLQHKPLVDNSPAVKKGVHAYAPANFSFTENDVFSTTENKENENVSPKKIGAVGLGLGVGKRASTGRGREVLRRSGSVPSVDRAVRHKKMRRPTIDIPSTSAVQKRHTALHSPLPPSPALLASPAIGEVKGWFSNLFTWKTQMYLLASRRDIITTRNVATVVLEGLGVIVALDESGGDGVGTLRCHIDDITDIWTGAVIQKQMRFRVELSTAPTSQMSAERYSPLSPLSNPVHSSPARYSLGKHASNGIICAIVLVLEKGPLPVFRAVCKRLRDGWMLDLPPADVGRAPGIGNRDHRAIAV